MDDGTELPAPRPTAAHVAEVILEALPVGVIVWGPERRARYVNAAYNRIYSDSPVHPGDPMEPRLQARAQAGEFGPGEPGDIVRNILDDMSKPVMLERPRPDGRWVAVRRAPLPDGGHVITISDQTELYQARRDTAQHADTLDKMLNGIRHGIALYHDDGTLIASNRLAAEMSGVPAEVMVPGTPFSAIRLAQLEAGEFGLEEQQKQEFLARRPAQPWRGPERYRRTRPNGRTIEITTDPLPSGGFVRTYSDITDIVAAQDELSLQADRMRVMLDGMRHGLALFDNAGRVVAANRLAAEMCGLGTDQFVPGVTLRELFALQVQTGEFPDSEATRQMIQRVDTDWHLVVGRYVRRRPNGRIIEVVNDPLPDGGVLRTYTDITEITEAETRLNDQARLMNTMLEGLPQSVVLTDANGIVLAVNRNANRIARMSEDELRPGVSIIDVLRTQAEREGYASEEERQAFLGFSLPTALQPGHYVRRRVCGQVVDVLVQQLEGGNLLRVVTDITDLQNAQEQARARANLLQAMLENIRHGLVLYGPDRRVLAANRLAAELTGVADLHTTPGRSIEEVLSLQLAAGAFGPPEIGRAQHDWQLALDRTMSHAHQRVSPDGRLLEITSDPTADGGFVVSMTDSSRLARAESEAKRRAEVLGAMLENIGHGVCLFDGENRLLAANDVLRDMLLLDEALLRPGTHFRDYVMGLLANGSYGVGAEAVEAAQEYLAMDRRQPSRRQRQTPLGQILDVVSQPIPSGGFVLTYTDVTEDRSVRAELERARDAAEQANASKSRFLATMSHELRTPLTAVIGFAEALQRDPDAPRREEYVASIHEAGKHLLSLINDILDLAKAEQGSLPVQEGRVDLRALLQGVGGVMRGEAEQAGLQLSLRLPAQMPALRGDDRRLRQVLLNLLANAVKFTPSGGRVVLGAEPVADGGWAIIVADSGIGMHDADIPRAFQPFQQLDDSLARRFEGTGLGLPLARMLTEAQGGTLTLHSRRGEGTTALIRFPADRVIPPEPA
ncbi:PAS domain-containing protein [Rhodovarius crocodyli]|uniref:histidine kinase n=1 Tax=Rhodovarius crocodyli TaxID=1979269 RepID=A0A437M3K8_9PROT|nr:PAS-domain containing protein [Rhodovarius crocodyli]RVT92287.1 PAS domain-containing protein [Rhodovarius crocodyli]